MLSLPSYIIGLFCRWRWRRVGLSLIDVHTRLALSLGTIRELSKKPPTNSSTSLAGNEKQKNSHCLYKHPSYNIVAITDLLWIFCPCKKLGVTFARSLEKHSVSCYVMRREPCSGLGFSRYPEGSSSAPSNLLEEELVRAYSNLTSSSWFRRYRSTQWLNKRRM